jgi:hypothetical protein
MTDKRTPSILSLVTGVGLAILTSGLLRAQELRARVQGVVTDTSDAVVVGASVTLRNVNTSVETVRRTNLAGQYLFDFVGPGTYTVTVEMEGFSTFVQQSILVQTRGDVTVNVVLKVGAVAETVNVTEAPVAVQFNTTTMQLTLDTKMANDLPLITRNPFLLASLNPAVVVRSTTEQSPYHHWAASQLDVGGNTSVKNDILVDGVPNQWGAKGSYVPPMDAVSELNVQQNSVDAEFGHSAGGILSLQMKSGTNDFHGTAYYFGRNPALNAVADSTTHRPNTVKNNVWGGTLGNPVVRGKVFNFFSYEGQNVREPRTMFVTLPTTLERQGDFTQTLNINGGLRQIHDPWTTRFDPASNTATRMPFANNTIPASRMDRASVRFLKDIWQPNNVGDDITRANNFKETYPQKFEYWNITNRTDWYMTEQWKMFGRFSRFRTTQSDPDFTGSPAQRAAGSKRNTLQFSADAVWTINPTTVFNIRGSYAKPVDDFYAAQSTIKPALLEEFWPGNPWYQSYQTELPVLYYPGLDVQAGAGSGFGRPSYWFQEPYTWNLQSKISKQLGRHYVKVGGEYRNLHVKISNPNPMGFTFGPQLTADTFINPNTRVNGDAWATFLLGAVDDQSRIATIPLNTPLVVFTSFYVHDDFKLSQKLTLNLGLRYEFETPLRDPQDRLPRYLDLTDPIPEFKASPPRMPSEVTELGGPPPIYNGAFVFTDSKHRGTWDPQKGLFMPRVGIAYRLSDRTALRVGWARYILPSSLNFDGGLDVVNNAPYPGFDQFSRPLPVLEGVPQARLSDPYPASVNPLIEPPRKTLGRHTQLGSTSQTKWFLQDVKLGVNDRFNFTLQRQIWSQVVVDATYFVNWGRSFNYQREMNLVNPQFGYDFKSLINRSVPNPFFRILTPDKFPGALRNQATVQVQDLLKPYPQYGRLTQLFTPGARQRYQALQLRVQRPFANGFNVLAGYNYNRARNDEFYDEVDQFADLLTLQSSPNPRHRLTGAAIYNLPFGRGRKFMANAHQVAEAILGDWSVSGIYSYNSAEFLRFGPAIVAGNPRIDHPTRERMFDTSKFTRQPAFTRRTNPLQYPGVLGPRFSNLDLSLSKLYPITERVKMEIRMEGYNFTNSFMGGRPNLNVDSSLFGRVTTQKAGYSGRQLQYTARLLW